MSDTSTTASSTMVGAVVIGIDPASKRLAFVARGVAAPGHGDSNEYLAYKAVKLSKKSGPEACANGAKVTRHFIEAVWAKWPECKPRHHDKEDRTNRDDKLPVVAYVESPVVGRGGVRSTMAQAFTSGAVQATLHEAGIEVRMANVSHWKKVVVGMGNAVKADVHAMIARRWPHFSERAGTDDDLNDAAAIALYGMDEVAMDLITEAAIEAVRLT